MRLRTSIYGSSDDSLTSYVKNTCLHPVPVKYIDINGKVVKKTVPCGKCLHCMHIRQDDWCTRMSMQSLTSKYTYFVTLTYSPEYLALDKSYFDDTYSIIKDNKPLPLLLCKRHLQKFIKRLRFNKKIDLQYYACGEYGEQFSRPHYHLVIWSDSLLQLDDIGKAWSLHGVSIGRIQFDNLTLNGTLNDLYGAESPDSETSSKYVFKYVSKYVNKFRQDITNIQTINLIKQYYEENISGKEFDRLPNKSNCPLGSYSFQDFSDFLSYFKPFTICSTLNPIGVDLLEGYVKQWTDEVPKQIELNGKMYFTPLFARKRFKSNLHSVLYKKSSDKPATTRSAGMVLSAEMSSLARNKGVYYVSEDCREDGTVVLSNVFLRSADIFEYRFYDVLDKKHIVVCPYLGTADYWQYDRRHRDYQFLYSIPFAEFLQYYDLSNQRFSDFLHRMDIKSKLTNIRNIKDISDYMSFNNMDIEQFNQALKQADINNIKEFELQQLKYKQRKYFKRKRLHYEC